MDANTAGVGAECARYSYWRSARSCTVPRSRLIISEYLRRSALISGVFFPPPPKWPPIIPPADIKNINGNINMNGEIFRMPEARKMPIMPTTATTISSGKIFWNFPTGTTSGTSLGGGTVVSTIVNSGAGSGFRGGIQGRVVIGSPR